MLPAGDHLDTGAAIPGMGGIRKMRYGLRGEGKRGGMRVIYYWVLRDETMLCRTPMPKMRRKI